MHAAGMECISYLQKMFIKAAGRFYAGHCKRDGKLGDELLQTAMSETNLPEARLRNERARTFFN